jgi:hypothetical protein
MHQKPKLTVAPCPTTGTQMNIKIEQRVNERIGKTKYHEEHQQITAKGFMRKLIGQFLLSRNGAEFLTILKYQYPHASNGGIVR